MNKTCVLCDRPTDWRYRKLCADHGQALGNVTAAKANTSNWRIEMVHDAKNGKSCTDCGLPYPWYVLQFDHVPGRGLKMFGLANPPRGIGDPSEIEAEMAKCDIVCANCHAERTHRRIYEGV